MISDDVQRISNDASDREDQKLQEVNLSLSFANQALRACLRP